VSGREGDDENLLDLSDDELIEFYSRISEDELAQILEETRASIDGYVDILSDIDDKAARTLRLNTLIFGFILTFAGLVMSGSNEQFAPLSQYVNVSYFVGLLATGISATLALITYTQSQIRSGFSVRDVETIFQETLDDKITTNPKILLFNRVRSHIRWIQQNRSVNRRDSNMLFASHVFLMISLGNYALAVLMGSISVTHWFLLLVLSPIVSLLLTVIVTLPKNRLWPTVSGTWVKIDDNILSRFRR
jgi:hypothetical protein